MPIRRAATLLFLLAAFGPSAAGAAESGGPGGTIRSIACGKLESPYSFDVALEDDSPTYARLGRALASELQKRRVEVSAEAPLRLSLSVDTVRAPSRHRRADLGRLHHDTDRGTQVRLNLWSNQHDSLIGGRREGVTREAVDELRVEIAINDKSNGRCIWHGEAVVDLDGRDADEAASTIVPLLVAHIGESVRAEPITLD
jgi:hypothetical protein